MKKKAQFMIIGLLLLIGLTGFNFLSDSKYHSTNFVPENYAYFVYLKDLASFKKEIQQAHVFKGLEGNYFYEDLRVRFSKNMDLFFLQSDFDLDYLLSLVKKDGVVGKSAGRFFLAAALSVKAQAIEKLFRMLPSDQKEELSEKSYQYFKVNKGGRAFYYLIAGDYLLLADHPSVLEAMVNSGAKKYEPLDQETKRLMTQNDCVFHYRPSPDYNLLGLLPDGSELSVHYQAKHRQFRVALKHAGEYQKVNAESNGYDFLKFSGYDTPFCYYKSSFSLNEIIGNVSQTEKGQAKLAEFASYIQNSAQKLSAKIKPGFFAALNGVAFPSKDETLKLNVESSLIFQSASSLNAREKTELTEELKKSLEYFFGVEQWQTTTNEPKNYQVFTSKESDLSLIVYQHWLIVSFTEAALQNILAHIDQTVPSVYDRYQKTFKANGAPAVYSYLNLTSLLEKLEPVLKFYTLSQLQMDDEEYGRSFGPIIQQLKLYKPFYLSLSYSREGKKHHGVLKQMD